MEQQKLLLKCDNTIYADEIAGVLSENGIASRQHEEYIDAAGRQIGISVFVYAADYEKACEVTAPIINERNKVRPMCPKCGSEDVEHITAHCNNTNVISISCIFCFLLPGIYIGFPDELMVHNDILDIIAALMAIAGVIIIVYLSRKGKNYKCRKCGKKFYHID